MDNPPIKQLSRNVVDNVYLHLYFKMNVASIFICICMSFVFEQERSSDLYLHCTVLDNLPIKQLSRNVADNVYLHLYLRMNVASIAFVFVLYLTRNVAPICICIAQWWTIFQSSNWGGM